MCYLFWCFIANSCRNKGSCLQRELNVGHLSYFACKHYVESPCLILAEVTHQLLVSPCSFILDKDFKDLTNRQAFTVICWVNNTCFLESLLLCFSGSKDFVLAPALVKVRLSQPRHIGSPTAVCNFRTKSFLPGFYLILGGVLVK